ncbi:MAG: transposase [Oscillospiraceae bacterium]|nr:transposase [Oscillospiraceae bacterium]
MGHSKDFKERAVSYRLEGHTVAETSKIFGIGTDTLNRWLRQYRETGSLSEKPLNRTFRKINPEKLKKYIEEHPDAMQKEMAEVFHCSKSGICKALKQNKITFKKRHSLIKSKVKKK